MGFHIALRVDQRCEVGIQRSDKRDKRHSFCRATLAILQEIKEDYIQWTSRLSVPRQCEMGSKVWGILRVGTAADVVWLRELGRREIWIYDPSLAIVEQELHSEALIEGHIRCL